MLQIMLTLTAFMVLVIPMGHYLYHIAVGQKTFADPVFDPVDRLIYKLCGLKGEDMGWKKYGLSLLMANAVMVLIGYAVLRLQGILFFNPNGIGAMEESSSFNTIISFMTNTNLQHYSGESGLSYGSQMGVIIFMMFTSAASGYAACMAFLPGAGWETAWEFLYRYGADHHPGAGSSGFLVGLFLVSQGTPQTMIGNLTVKTVEGSYRILPWARWLPWSPSSTWAPTEAAFLEPTLLRLLENPTVLSNMAEMLSMMLLPGACVVTFGLMLHDRKQAAGRETVGGEREERLAGSATDRKKVQGHDRRPGSGCIRRDDRDFSGGTFHLLFSEKAGNPVIAQMGIDQSAGSMEGKEVRFGIPQSSLFTTVTTSFTTGTVNNMHDTRRHWAVWCPCST